MTVCAVQQSLCPEWPIELLARLMCQASGRDDEEAMRRELELCASLRQFQLYLRDDRLIGMFAWLRGDAAVCREHFVEGSIDTILTLPPQLLRHGSHVMVVAVLAIPPLSAYKIIRETALWPNVDVICGWRRGNHYAEERTRRGNPERVSDERHPERGAAETATGDPTAADR